MPVTVSQSLSRNLQWLQKRLNLKESDDYVQRSFTALGQDCSLIYLEGLTDGSALSEFVLRPLLRATEVLTGSDARMLAMNRLIEATSLRVEADLEEAAKEIMNGQVALLMDTVPEAVLLELRRYVHRPISNPISESVVDGPHEAFNEVLRDNLTLLHRKLKSPLLVCKLFSVGKVIPTQVALCYMDGVCPQETVQELLHRLEAVNADVVQSGGELQQLIEDNPYDLLPQALSTERPDRVVSFLLEGQAALLVDGSPQALAMPVGFWHVFHAPDDHSSRWQQGTFMRLVRFLGIFFAVLFPALFVTLVVYHPGALPMTLITSIMESRTVVPISLFGEAFLMQTVFNLINEAHTRVPGMMGSSLGLVSALILGSAAVEASLISPLLIIIVALSGLGTFSFPNYSVSFAFRMMQLLLLLAGWIMGLAGVLLCSLLFLCRIAGMTSLGAPYLAPRSPYREHNPDLLVRKPTFRQRLHSYLAQPSNASRSQGPMRGFFPGKERK